MLGPGAAFQKERRGELATVLDRHLSQEHRAFLERIPDDAARSGVRVHLVGGSVRDLLLGRTPTDLDLAVSGEGDDPVMSLIHALGGMVTAESQFGTARGEVEGVEFDVARTRRERYGRPGALPQVTFTDCIEEDLTRRDFTIHAIAASLNRGDAGAVLDPLGGRRDLAAGRVRVLHPLSFEDDPTRILRAVRYAGRLGFEIEGETARLLAESLRWLDSVSGDRIRSELERTAAEECLGDILELAARLGVLRAVHPALSLAAGLAARLREGPAPSFPGLIAALAASAGDTARDSLVRRLNLAHGHARAVRDVGKVRSRLAALRRDSASASETYGLLEDAHPGAVEAWGLVHEDDRVRCRLADYLHRMRGLRPILGGRGVMALGVGEGPAVGGMLRALLMARLDGEVSSRDDEERFVRLRLESRP